MNSGYYLGWAVIVVIIVRTFVALVRIGRSRTMKLSYSIYEPFGLLKRWFDTWFLCEHDYALVNGQLICVACGFKGVRVIKDLEHEKKLRLVRAEIRRRLNDD